MEKEFIKFLLASKILSFGEFQTKSGRISPYFFNFGSCDDGEKLAHLSTAYAKFIYEKFSPNIILFGPAYKGIPLVSATSLNLQTNYKANFKFCFNRKEAKNHGEKGILVGSQLKKGDKILIIEDVMTAGTAIRESLDLLNQYSVEVIGVLIAVDRQEKGLNNISAIEEFKQKFDLNVQAIVNLDMIEEYAIQEGIISPELQEKISLYRKQYGC